MSQKNLQSPHWAETVATDVLTWQKQNKVQKLHVDDMKTPSGRVHTGALRGVVLHDIVAKTLAKQTTDVVSTYVFNDFDVMDGLPKYLDAATYEPHMGEPLYRIPAPPLEKSGINVSHSSAEEIAELRAARNFAELYAIDFIHAFRRLGCTQEIVWSHELYESGQMDPYIKTALDSVNIIKKIYIDIADYKLPDHWYPFQVVCPQCGKLGTTLVSNWDGEQVEFDCLPDKVTWAKGCGFHGKTSPFGGTGKLLWKTDWPAHWALLGVTIEGAGKDHTSAGGSRDMANQLITNVFNKISPFDVPYEWILIRGAKMSSSKGIGTSAREFIELFPPEIGRFLFVNKFYGQVIDFDPQTMAIPDLFDEYDEAARIYWKQTQGDERSGQSFVLSQISNNVPEAHFLPRFRDLALWMQHPEIELAEKFAEVKGSPLTTTELDVLKQRQHYAQLWVNRYAPDEYQLSPRVEVPAAVDGLSSEQRQYLGHVKDLIGSQTEWQPQPLQQALFDLAKDSLGARKGFEAIYTAFLGRKAGPRAAWFLLAMNKNFRDERLTVVATELLNNSATEPTSAIHSPQIESAVRQQFPGVFFAQVEIKGVRITDSNSELEIFKTQVLEQFSNLTSEAVSNLAPIQAYRKLFKATGVDFHKKRPSPEALLRRIAKQKGLYTINTAVDAYNLAVIETGVGLGGFDAGKILPPVMLRFSKDGEQMLLHGDPETTVLEAGHLVYADKQKLLTLDLNYRDIQATALTTETVDILLCADGAPGLTKETVTAALQRGAEYIQRFCDGEIGQIEIFE